MPTINGTLGDDTLTGTENADELYGDAGDDRLIGGGGADTLTGGTGRDYFYFSAGESIANAFDTITDFTSGTDTLIFNRSGIIGNPISIVRQGAGSVIFVSHPGLPQTVVAVNAVVGGGDVLLAISPPTLYVSVTMVGLETSETQIGGRMSDLIYGLGGDDVLIGGRGADAISGGAGADTFLYRDYYESVATYLDPNGPAGSTGRSPGFDNLFDFETGLDTIDITAVGLQSVSIIRQDGSSFLFGSIWGATVPFQIVAAGRAINASDLIGYNRGVYMVGSGANDILSGGSGADGIVGNDGDDIITGGAGADALSGGSGRDVFRFYSSADSNAAQFDNLFDFETLMDTIDLRTDIVSIGIVRQDSSSFLFVDTGDGTLMVTSAGRDINGTDIAHYGSLFRSGVTMIGSEASDQMISAGNSLLVGGGGDDQLIVYGGGNTLNGGSGFDRFTINSGAEIDWITDFQTGEDYLIFMSEESAWTNSASIVRQENGDSRVVGQYFNTYYGAVATLVSVGHDVNLSDIRGLRAGVSGAAMVGSTRDDILIGSYSKDFIRGGGGDDIIIGDYGADILTGGAGADVFKYRIASDSTVALPDTIEDFVSGIDKIDLTAVHTGGASDKLGIAYMTGGSLIFVDLGGDGTADMVIQLQNVTLQLSDILWSGEAGSSSLASSAKNSVGSVTMVDNDELGLTGSDIATSSLSIIASLGKAVAIAPIWESESIVSGDHHDQGWWL